MSASTSLVSIEDFKSMLMEMEAKGCIACTRLHGQRAYRRLLIDNSTIPKVPLDEMRLALGSLEAKKKDVKIPQRVTAPLVKRAQKFGKQLFKELRTWLNEVSLDDVVCGDEVYEHIERMRIALSESEDTLLEYVQTETPGILDHIGHLLRYHGSEFLMLSLRLLEVQERRYFQRRTSVQPKPPRSFPAS
jgi:hypothetical protein